MALPGGVATQMVIPPLAGTIPLIPHINGNKKDKSTKSVQGQKIRTVILACIGFAFLSQYASFKIAENVYSTFFGSQYSIIDNEGWVTMKGYAIMTGIFLVFMSYIVL